MEYVQPAQEEHGHDGDFAVSRDMEFDHVRDRQSEKSDIDEDIRDGDGEEKLVRIDVARRLDRLVPEAPSRNALQQRKEELLIHVRMEPHAPKMPMVERTTAIPHIATNVVKMIRGSLMLALLKMRQYKAAMENLTKMMTPV